MTAGVVVATLRQYRAQIVITAVLIAVLASAAVIDGGRTASFIAAQGADICPSPGCAALADQVAQRYQVFGALLPAIGLLPAAVGALWGAPLLGREFENGTTHFAWTQSVTRRKWLLTRFVVLGFLIAVGALLLGTALDSWLSAFNGFDLAGAVQTDFSFSHMRGTAPVGWWLFAFSLGALMGTLLRRTVPAMVVTIIATVVAVSANNLWLGAAIEGLTLSDALRLQHIETASLIAVAVFLAVATSWSVEHAPA